VLVVLRTGSIAFVASVDIEKLRVLLSITLFRQG